MSVNKSSQKTQSTSAQALTPNNDVLLGAASRSQALADQPVTPYSGSLSVGMDTGASEGSLQSLLGYNAPRVSTAQNVSNDQIKHYMDPYLEQVVGATANDIDHQRMLAQNSVKFDPAFGGGSRDAVYRGTIDGEYGRTAGTVLGSLRSAGFNNAVGYGQTDLQRILGADTTNQNADIAGAGIRAGAATSLASIQAQRVANERANQKALYDEFVRQQQQPFLGQQLANQGYGLLYNGPLTSQQSSGSGSSFGFSLPPPPPVPA